MGSKNGCSYSPFVTITGGTKTMANAPKRKSEAARRANQMVRSRTLLVMLMLGVVTFILLFWKLYDLQIRQHDELQERAVAQ